MLEVTGQVTLPRRMNSDILNLLILESAQTFKTVGRLFSLRETFPLYLLQEIITAHMLLGSPHIPQMGTYSFIHFSISKVQ